MAKKLPTIENITFKIKKNDRVFKRNDVLSINLIPNGINYIVGPNGSGKTTLMHYIRATRHSLGEMNRGMFDGMKNDDDMIYEGSQGKLFEITGLDQFDDIYVLDSVDDDPLSFTNAATVSGFIMGGGMSAKHKSKGERAIDIISRFIIKMSKYTGYSVQDLKDGKKYKKHPLIIVDEVDEGMDLKHQSSFNRMLKNMSRVWNATIIAITHNVMAMILESAQDGQTGLEMPVYDLATFTSKTLGEYIQEQAGVTIEVKPVEVNQE